MNISNLIFVGLGKHVIALHRTNGTTVWVNSNLNRGYTSLMLDGDRLVVSANGYLYCLDPLTGKILWSNELKGFGMGAASLASVRGRSGDEAGLYAAVEDARRQSD